MQDILWIFWKSETTVGIGELIGFGILLAVGVYCNGDDFLLCQGAVIAVGFHGGNGIHCIHAGGHLAKSGVLAVQVLGILVHDEKLGTSGVGGGGTGHAENAPLVLQIILEAVEEKFALDAVAGAAHAGTFGAAALNHEAGNDPVEDQAVIVVVVAQVDEVVDALGCGFGVQLAFDNTAVCHGDFKSGIHS